MVTKPEAPPAAEAEPSDAQLAADLLKEGEAADSAPESQAEAPVEVAEAKPAAGAETPKPAETKPAETPKPPRLEESQEWRRAQGAWQRQVAEERKQRLALQDRLDTLDVETQVEAFRREHRDRLVAQNYEPQAADQAAGIAAGERRERLKAEARARQTERESQERFVQSETANALMLAKAFQSELGLVDADVEVLMEHVTPQGLLTGAVNPRAFERTARHIAELRKAATAAGAAKKAEVPAGQKVGAGATQPVSTPTEQEMFRRYSAGDDAPEVKKFMDTYMSKRGY